MTRVKRLDAVCEIVMGQAPEGESYNTEGRGLPLLAGAGDFGDGYPLPQKFTTTPTKTCRPGDIILGIRATIGEKVTADREYCLGRGVAGLRPRDGLELRFLWHWLTHARPSLSRKGKGATFKQVNRADIGELQIALPPLSEQRRIAELLDRAESLRAKRVASSEMLRGLPGALFADLFGDEARILSRWATTKLGDLLEFMTSGSRGWAAYYAEEGDLFLRIQNVGRDELLLDDVAFVKAPSTAEAKRTRVRAGDVLLSITADLGRTAVIPDSLGAAFINQHLSILRTTELLPRFLSAYLTSPAGQRQIAGRNRQGVKAGLNFDDIRSFLVPMPPQELQWAYVRRVEVVEHLRGTALRSRCTLDELIASLQFRAFNGLA